MNNKRLGTAFEQEFCKLMASKGWWVHFITPAANGGQPFDVIAVKSGLALAIDCKTSASRLFHVSRLEENQKLAFDKWIRCGNSDPMIAVQYKEHIYMLQYDRLKREEVIDLEKEIFI